MVSLLLVVLSALGQGLSYTGAFPYSRESPDDPKALRVSITKHPPLQGVLGGTLTLPCHVTYLRPLPTSTSAGRHAQGLPRVKWTFVSEGQEVEILVARGLKVKVGEGYRDRVSLPFYPESPADATLVLSELRSNDSGIYRCDVQHGIEDGHDLVKVKVKGVVFHYREGTARYAYTFTEAQEACDRIDAEIATPEQLHAAYLSGYEQCDAGWIADQTVRYPIQTPREACYGDMDGLPGVRNYGAVDPGDMYDVYCYAEELYGELFAVTSPERFTWEEAKAQCQALGYDLATTGQLYAAWNHGLDHCNPGWLADGSVRYPIVTPRDKCGGNMPGVKTIFRFRNQTGFPEPESKYDAFCFQEETSHPSSEPPAPEVGGASQEIVTVTEQMEEIQLPPAEHQAPEESRGAIYAVPVWQGLPSSSPEETQTPAGGPKQGPPGGCGGDPGQGPQEEGREGGRGALCPLGPRTGGDSELVAAEETQRAEKDRALDFLQQEEGDEEEEAEEEEVEEEEEAPEASHATPTEGTLDDLAWPETSPDPGSLSKHKEGGEPSVFRAPKEPDVAPSEEEIVEEATGSGSLEGDGIRRGCHVSEASSCHASQEASEAVSQGEADPLGQGPHNASLLLPGSEELRGQPPAEGSGLPPLPHSTATWGDEQKGNLTGHAAAPWLSHETQPGDSELSGSVPPGTATAATAAQTTSLPAPLSPLAAILSSSPEEGEHPSGSGWWSSSGANGEGTPGPEEATMGAVALQPYGAGHGVEETPEEGLGTEGPGEGRARHTATPLATPGSGEDPGEGREAPEMPGLEFMRPLFTTTPVTTAPPRPALPTQRASLGSGGNISENCFPDPCQNGGTCTEEGEQVGCLCLPGYGGDTCEIDLEKCHPSWKSFQGFCYQHFSTRRSWEEAETHCRHHGGHLASILTPEEQSFLNDQYREYQWIGLNDRTIEGDFQWSDGSPVLYENWHPGQPDSYFLSGENCVVIVWHDEGKWSDVPCNYHLSYTCKMGLVSCHSPPEVDNARIFGKPKQRYEINAVVRYRCQEGFLLHRSPVLRCQENGQWEQPEFTCIPGAGHADD